MEIVAESVVFAENASGRRRKIRIRVARPKPDRGDFQYSVELKGLERRRKVCISPTGVARSSSWSCTEYGAGTLRERLGLPRPANRFASASANANTRHDEADRFGRIPQPWVAL